MTTTFKTEFSTYEVDYDDKRIRRVGGVNPPTGHFSPEKDWKSYDQLVLHNGRLFVYWPDGTFTVTSFVKDYE